MSIGRHEIFQWVQPGGNNAQVSHINFIELGPVNCIPCKKMQPVMKAVEEKFAGQVNLVFYGVWKADQKKYAQQYKIRLIPTQVFLDQNGTEIYRYDGFFPESTVCAFFEKQGLTADKHRLCKIIWMGPINRKPRLILRGLPDCWFYWPGFILSLSFPNVRF